MFAADNISTPISFNAYVSDEVALREGDEAADRIISGANVDDHLKLGRCLMVGSRIAAREAGSDHGKPYNIAFSKWLAQRPKLAAVNAMNRSAALWCFNEQNWPRVEKYLGTLDIEERQTITLRTVRRRLDAPPRTSAPKPTSPSAAPVEPAPVPPSTPKAAVSDRVQKIADSAEVATLRKEKWALSDKFDQLAMYLAENPPPKAEDRPVNLRRYWPMTMRPIKEAPTPRQIIDPPANDLAFALRKEEFEQFLMRRREALEQKFVEREAELAKTFEDKVKARIEARMATEDMKSRQLSDAQFLSFAACFHADKRKHMTERDWDRTFNAFMSLRNRLVKLNAIDKRKAKAKAKTSPPPASRPSPTGSLTSS